MKLKLSSFLEKKERAVFDLQKTIDSFHNACRARVASGWDQQARDCIKIMTNNLPFEDDINGVPKSNNKHFIVNFVKRNLYDLASKLMIADVQVDLHSEKGERTPIIDITEQKINACFDKYKIQRKSEQDILSYYFMGMGVCRMAWNPKKIQGEWKTGQPVYDPIDPRKFYLDPATRKKDKTDRRYCFHVEAFDLESLKRMFPKHKELIEATAINPDTMEMLQFRDDVVDVVVMQFRKTHTIKKRAITDEDGNMTTYVLEEEYEEYLNNLKNETGEGFEITPERGQEYEENLIFPEAVMASDVLEVDEEAWFQVIFLPDLNITLETPKYVGKMSDYIVMPGYWNPDSAYSTSMAMDNKDLLEISGIMMTIQMLNTVKVHKPIPIVEAGALLNEPDFLLNYHKLGVKAVVDPEWRKKNPALAPVSWLAPPQDGRMQLLLDQKIENAIEQNTRSTKPSRGLAESAGESGKSIGLKQAAAAEGAMGDYYVYQEFLRQVAERLKEHIITKQPFEHKIFGLTQQNERGYLDINTDISNSFSSLGDDVYTEITLEENAEITKINKEQKYERLFEKGMVAYADTMRNLNLPNVEKIIENRNSEQQDLQMVEMINSNPEIKNAVMEMLQRNPELQAQKPSNV